MMNKIIRHEMTLLAIAVLVCFASAVTAKTVDVELKDQYKNPLGCRNVGYQFKLKTLRLLPQTEGEQQALYFVLNKLSRPVHLYQMLHDDNSRSTYLNHTIHAQQWAVVATNEKQLHYVCTVDDAKSSYGKIVDCGQSIQVCEYVRVKFGLNNRGNYWVVNSNTRGGAVNEVLHYGIIPR